MSDPLREAHVDGDDHCSIPSDDAPATEADRLHVMFGGNLDYYIAISDGPGTKWPVCAPSFRACTSGARNYVVTTIFAALFFAIRGKPQRAAELLRIALRDLER